MSTPETFIFIFCIFTNTILFALGLALIKEGVDGLVLKRDFEYIFPLVCGILVVTLIAHVLGMAFGVLTTPALLGATLCDWDAKMKVRQLLKEGKIYDYSLREATDDAHQMANEYHCRAWVIDVDGTGDFDVVLTKPEDDTLIMREIWPYKWVEDAKTKV